MNNKKSSFFFISRFFALVLKGIHNAREHNYKAKDILIFACYVFIVLFSLPSAIEAISSVQNPQDSTHILNYVMIIFVPLVRLVVEFGANLVGLCVLFICAILSVKYKILQNYIVLFVLYMACAYPSFWLLGEWKNMPSNLLTIANNDFLELLRLVFAKKAYFMAIFIYAKRVCYIFLLFALFDLAFFVLKNRATYGFCNALLKSVPKIVWINLIFSFALCVATIVAYMLCADEFIWLSWFRSICFIFGF
ncbi:hypothetical protein [Helicobacter sp. T3_23-1056]